MLNIWFLFFIQYFFLIALRKLDAKENIWTPRWNFVMKAQID
jgi:hypothetical protein